MVAPPPDALAGLFAAGDDFLVVGEESFVVPPAPLESTAAAEILTPAAATTAEAASIADVVEVFSEALAAAEVAPAAPELSFTTPLDSSESSAPAMAGPAQEPAPEPVVASLDTPLDEDAAMRAIEGNWTPRRPPPRAARSVAPEESPNKAVAASARAVASARRTAEAVVADATQDAGKPAGLDAPREGRKDDLSHIIGVLPVIETALNKLGIYHFDQLAALSGANVDWIENHLGIPGRIGRELWREQARELSAMLNKPKRAAEN
jgi:predicted flap endonuclease-1-like 5' DNA nuclease